MWSMLKRWKRQNGSNTVNDSNHRLSKEEPKKVLPTIGVEMNLRSNFSHNVENGGPAAPAGTGYSNTSDSRNHGENVVSRSFEFPLRVTNFCEGPWDPP